MKEILGFIVLSSPLFLIVLWLPVCIGLGIWVGRNLLSKRKIAVRVVVGMLVFLFAMVAPLVDEIAGRIYFNHLCATEAGATIYQTIELPAKYWDEDGNAKFINSRGVLDMKMLEGRFEWKRTTAPYWNFLIRIEEDRWLLYDKKDKKALGEKKYFTRYYGWINRFSPAPNVAEGCRNILAKKYGRSNFHLMQTTKERDFILNIFMQPTSTEKE